MKNIFKFLGIIALAAVIGFSFVACGGGGKVILTEGSHGFAGDGVIFGLEKEKMYIVRVQGDTDDFFAVQANGTFHYGPPTLGYIFESEGEDVLQPLEFNTINLLTNGVTYTVYMVIDADGGVLADAKSRNAILDWSEEIPEDFTIDLNHGNKEGTTSILFYLGLDNVIGGRAGTANLKKEDQSYVIGIGDWDAEEREGSDGTITWVITPDKEKENEFSNTGAFAARAKANFFELNTLNEFNQYTMSFDDGT